MLDIAYLKHVDVKPHAGKLGWRSGKRDEHYTNVAIGVINIREVSNNLPSLKAAWGGVIFSCGKKYSTDKRRTSYAVARHEKARRRSIELWRAKVGRALQSSNLFIEDLAKIQAVLMSNKLIIELQLKLPTSSHAIANAILLAAL